MVLVLAGFLPPLSALDFTVYSVEGILSLNGCHVLRNAEDYPLMTISVLDDLHNYNPRLTRDKLRKFEPRKLSKLI